MLKTQSILFTLCLLIGCSGSELTSAKVESPIDANAVTASPQLSVTDDAGGAGSSQAFVPVKLTSQHLPNPVQLHPKVISGGLPEDDAAFQELADLGVKTVISVDGMTPDVTTAAKHGLRYVHLPHGYDGIPEQRIKELAKAVRDLEGPIYIHCHHGKHRSPAAASVACVSAGLIPARLAVPILELAGTNPGYKGLYEAAQQATAFDKALLNELQVEFKEVQKIPPMAEAMVHLSHADEHLKLIAAANWKSPENHPDLVPAHEALLMREIFTEMLRTDEVARQPEEFRKWLQDSEADAQQLEAELKAWITDQNVASPLARLTELSAKISANCKACHQKYRDVPPGERQLSSE
ncbi:MAG: hypothetical protein WBH50_00105 [Fuerstiella sp.]